ncbi:MAG: crossover junction endodeoxyribonuclease RuvC, partial [Clostridia bacterium]|nr:crossover junction endodeoxyribonuclease RuvC [Clostridia bacterium]
GSITTPAKTDVEKRLLIIQNDLETIINKYKPDEMAIEELFFNTNITTGIAVAEARGVILCTAHKLGVKISEYTPLQVKQAVVGYGKAEKQQVIAMVTSLLKLPKPPKPDDTADAIAIAICHSNSSASALGKYYNQR